MNNQRRTWLKTNDRNWYVIKYTNGSIDLKHRTGLSNILECGQDMKDFGIISIEQCGN